jgi:hypothetical protein
MQQAKAKASHSATNRKRKMAPMRATTDVPARLDGRQGAGESRVAEGEEEEEEEAMEGDGRGRRRAARKRAFKYGDATAARSGGMKRKISLHEILGEAGAAALDPGAGEELASHTFGYLCI